MKRRKQCKSIYLLLHCIITVCLWAEPLLKSDKVKFTLNERLRYEARNILNYTGVSATSSDYLFNRTRIGIEWNLSKQFGTFLQIQDSRVLGRKPDGIFLAQKKNTPVVIQGYFEFKNIFTENLNIKIGRQKLSFFSQRLVSPLEWHNVSRTWDAIKFTYLTDKTELNIFGSFPSEAHHVVPKKFDYENRLFNGITYQIKKISNSNLNIGFYLFNRIFNDTNFISETGVKGKLHDWTYGTNINYEKKPLFFEVELTKQSGKRSIDDIDSWGIIGITGVKIEKFYNYKGFIEISWASGDNNSADGKLKTFDPLYTFAHEYWGHIDLIGFRNITSYGLRNQWTIDKDGKRFIETYLDFYIFTLNTLNDKWYGAGLTPIRNSSPSTTHKEIGKEIDLEFKIYPAKHYTIWIGQSIFWPGGFVKETGFSKTAHFTFLSIELSF